MSLKERIRMSDFACTLWPPSVEEVLRRFEGATEIVLDRVSIMPAEIEPGSLVLLNMPLVEEIIPQMMKSEGVDWSPHELKEVVPKLMNDCRVYVILDEESAILYTNPVTRMTEAWPLFWNRRQMSVELVPSATAYLSADLRAFQNSQILIRRKPRKKFWDEERVRVRVGGLFYSSPAGSD